MKKTLIFLTLFSSVTAFSQEEQQVIVIRQSDLPSRSAKKAKIDRNVENYNAFKFDPLRIFIGELNFSWEHRLGEKTSYEIELGPTISNLSYTTNGDHLFVGGYSYTNQESGMGVLASAAFRFYPLENYSAMNKLYISPRIKYRRYNETYSFHGTDVSLPDRKGSSDEVIFSFNVGFQDWISDNFAFDYYVGLGIGSYSQKSSYTSVNYNNNTGMDEYAWVDQSRSLARVVGVIGIKVTIGN